MVTPSKSGPAPEPPQIVAYRVSNTLTVRIRDLSQTGTILDVTVSVGANSISGPNFTVEDMEPLRDAVARGLLPS